LSGAFTLRNLETLAIEGFEATSEDLVCVLSGRDRLRDLDISITGVCLASEIVGSVPPLIERLKLNDDEVHSNPESNQCLRTIGKFTNLKELQLSNLAFEADWAELLPAASRIFALEITHHFADDEKFSAFLPAAKNLKKLVLDYATGDCSSLLCAISLLKNLESLLLGDDWNEALTLRSEDSLLALARGPARLSLTTCCIRLRILMAGNESEDSLKREQANSLLQCFREEVEPLFEKQAVGCRELIFSNYSERRR